MMRILFWLALAFLVLMAIRSKLKGILPARPAPPPEVEAMLCCAHCGVFYPESETVKANGRNYCSQAHAHLS